MLPQNELRPAYDASDSMFGFDQEVYAQYMPYESVKDILKDGVSEKEWNDDVHTYTVDTVLEDCHNYMIFAIGKATDHRGLSASRSIDKMKAYTKILGTYDEFTWLHYANYGAPILKAICDKYGWQDLYEGQDDFIRMAQGKPCHDGCMDGCS